MATMNLTTKSQIPHSDGVELTDYQKSPNFPKRSRTQSESCDPDTFDDLIVQSTSVSSSCDSGLTATGTSNTPGSSKRHLKFPGELLDLTARTILAPIEISTSPKTPRSAGSSNKSSDSPIPPLSRKASQRIKFIDVAGPGEVKLKTCEGGQYSVTPTDASLIGRIAHKAPRRAHRVLEPHEVFVELEELRSENLSDPEWEETARWIKFEEDVEQETGRWGRPHVSALAFHSVVDLRKGLERGIIMLDVSGDNFPVIVDKIVDQLVESDQLQETEVDFVLQALYKKHKHQHQITIWDDLKHAARSADGTIHHIGDQLRNRHNTNNHSKLNMKSDDFQGKHSSMRDKLVPVEVHEVTFSVGIPEEDNSVNHGDPSSPQLKPTLQVTNPSALLENGDNHAAMENELPKLKRSHPSVASMISHNDEKHKLSRSVQDLLEKIPQHAESLTVLVGGVDFLKDVVVAFIRLEQSHLLGDLTEVPVPVRFIYLMLGPVGLVDYHEVGRAMATLMSDKCFHELAYSAQTSEELLDGLDQFLEDSIVLPPGDWDQDLLLPLMHKRNELRRKREKKLEEVDSHQQHGDDDPIKCSKKPFLGLVKDVKRLVKRYPSDLLDAIHLQPLLAIFFVYISCIAPAIAFGGLMQEVTHSLIGVTETLVGTGLCGVLYGLFSVQPLSIIAFTGPLLLFEEIFIEFAHLLHIDYLAWRACIGLWLMIIIILFSISELTFLVRSFTRFSEEIFTGVIAFFFIVEAFRTIIKIYQRNPVCGFSYPCGAFANCSNTCVCDENETMAMMRGDVGSGLMDNSSDSPGLPHGFTVCNQVNTALWSTLLCLCTFLIAVLLRKFRHSRFLGKQARRLVSDFGMFTAIGTMVTIEFFLQDTITVETLSVLGWKVSDPSQRGWLINPLQNLKPEHIVEAIIPACLLGILIYIENQLTIILVNKHEHHLVKGVGYHFDLFLVGIFAGICGIFGLPWVCAAPVRSIQHLQALSRYSTKNAPGEKPRLLYVYEQRVTNIAVHVLILLSPFAYPILQQIPFPVIIGVFFYLAYASMSGIQLRKRVKLLFMPPKHHPDVHYVRKVRTWKMNLYTVIQVCCVGLLYGLKLSPAGMAYPLAIVLMIPLRMLLGKYVFTKVEMEALNSEEDIPDDDNDGADEFAEYEETHIPY